MTDGLLGRRGQYRTTDGSRAGFEAYARGGQATGWDLDSEPTLFLSRKARFAPDTAIRGGIPVCFPWFGNGPSGDLEPQHGFVRKTDWTLVEDSNGEHSRTLVWQVTSEDTADAEGAALFPHRWTLTQRQVFGDDLTVELTVRNDGDTAFRCEELLHTYLAVGDVERITVEGLDGSQYTDKTDGFATKTQQGAIRFTGKVDRVHDSAATCTVEDPSLERRIVIDKTDSASTVVWNPWSDGVADFTDLAADEWRAFVCVESGNVAANAIEVAPGATHTMSISIRVP